MLGKGDQLLLERLCRNDDKAVAVVTRALTQPSEANMQAAHDVLEPFREQSHANLYWWLTFDSEPEIVDQIYELFSYPFESFHDLLKSYCATSSVGAGGVARFHYMKEKLKAEGYAVRVSKPCPSFGHQSYGGYDKKAESLWEFFNVLSTGEDGLLFAEAAANALKAMSQADIALEVLTTLEPDQKESLEAAEDNWLGVRLGCLVAVRSWKRDKPGRLSAKAHKKEGAAQKDFEKKRSAAEAKLRE